MDFSFVNVVVCDPGYEAAFAHTFQPSSFIKVLVTKRIIPFGLTGKIQQHLQEKRGGIIAVSVVAVFHDLQVFGLLRNRRIQIKRRIPNYAILGIVGQIQQITRLVAAFNALFEKVCHRRP